MRRAEARRTLLTKFLQSTGPVTVEEVCERFGWGKPAATELLNGLAGEGSVARGEFLPDTPSPQFCWQANLEALHRETLRRLKAEIEPLSLDEYCDFVVRWQHAHPSTRLKRKDGLVEVIRRLEGYATDPQLWMRHILPNRVEDFEPSWLCELIEDGTIVYWGAPTVLCEPTSMAHLWVDDDPREHPPDWPDQMPAYERAIQVYDRLLALGGVTTLAEVARMTGLSTAEAQDALRDLYGRGLVTNTSPAYPLDGHHAEVGRWVSCLSLRDAATPKPLDEEGKARRKVLQALQMFGIASAGVLTNRFPGVLALRCNTLNAAEVRRGCEQLVGRGEAIKGLFVRDLEGEQYALPSVPEQARAARSAASKDPMVMISSMDPASLYIRVMPVPALNAYCFPRRFMVLDGGRLAAVVDQKSGPEGRFVADLIHVPAFRAGAGLKPSASEAACRLIDALADFVRRWGGFDTLDVLSIEGRPASAHPMSAVFLYRGSQVTRRRLRVSLDALKPWEPDSLPRIEAAASLEEEEADLVAILQSVFEQAAGMLVTRLRMVGREALRLKGRTLVSVPDGKEPVFVRYGKPSLRASSRRCPTSSSPTPVSRCGVWC